MGFQSGRRVGLVDKMLWAAFVLLLCLYLVVNACVYWSFAFYKPFLLMIAVMLLLTAALFLTAQRIKSEKIAIIILAIYSLAILVFWNLFYKPLPVSDYRVIWDGAHQIIEGSFAERASDRSDYYAFFNFQIPYTFYISLLLRLYDSLWTIKAAEIATLVLTNILLFKILKNKGEVGKAFFCSALFASFPWVFIGSGIINNQHIGLLFGAAAVYAIVCSKSTRHYLLSALLLGIGDILRPTVVIFFLSIAVVLSLQCICKKRKLSALIVFVFTYFAIKEVANQLFLMSAIAPYGIKGNDYYFKFLLGLTGTGITGMPTTDAEHTFLYYDLQHYNFDYNAYHNASKDYLIGLFRERKIDVSFILSKMKRFITGIDNQYCFGDMQFNTEHVALIEFINLFGVIMFYTTILFSLVRAIRNRSTFTDDSFIIPSVVFCISFGIYIFIEVQTRYRYEQYFCLFILSGPAMFDTITLLIEWLRKKNFLGRRKRRNAFSTKE